MLSLTPVCTFFNLIITVFTHENKHIFNTSIFTNSVHLLSSADKSTNEKMREREMIKEIQITIFPGPFSVN